MSMHASAQAPRPETRYAAILALGMAATVGGALAIAQRIGPTAEPLVSAARQAFVDGMVIGSRVTAVVAVLGAVVALKWLPAHAQDEDDLDAELIELCNGQVATAEVVAADR